MEWDRQKVIIVLILLCLSLFPYCLRVGLTGATSQKEDFHYDRSRWRAILSEERETTDRPLYRPEDMMPERFQPEDWKVFYVLSEVPDGYILDGLSQAEDMDHSVGFSYVFYKLKDVSDPNGSYYKEPKLTFTQSKAEMEYVPIIQPNQTLDDVEEGTYYHREWKEGERIVYWRENDMFFCMKGDYDYIFLEEMANKVERFDVLRG